MFVLITICADQCEREGKFIKLKAHHKFHPKIKQYFRLKAYQKLETFCPLALEGF